MATFGLGAFAVVVEPSGRIRLVRIAVSADHLGVGLDVREAI